MVERRCIPISVLILLGRLFLVFPKTVVLFVLPSLIAVLVMLLLYKKNLCLSCGKNHKNPLRRRDKSRYRNASLTVEASFAFPIFFFAIMYLLQLFAVLRAELVIAEAGIASARDVAAFAYAEERLKEGENVAAEKLFELFDKKIVQDAAFTTVFYVRCDEEIMKNAGVAQKLGGMWVSTEVDGDTVRLKVYYRVEPQNPLFPNRQVYYNQRFVYRNWTGEGKQEAQEAQAETATAVVYLADNATVYHLSKDCTYINIKVTSVVSGKIGTQRNASGAKYYACDFCEPVLTGNSMVYITKYGTRYHAFSTCSAIERSPGECTLEEAKEKYPACKKCAAKQEKEGEQ